MSLKYFCDMCPKEVEGDGGMVTLENRQMAVQKRYDVCVFCYERVRALFTGTFRKLKREGLPDE